MKKNLLLMTLFTSLVADEVPQELNTGSEITVVDVKANRKAAMQDILHKSFGGIDPDIMATCVTQWHDSANCKELRAILIQYLIAEDLFREIVEETINKSKDEFVEGNVKEQA